MSNGEKFIVACASCQSQYNVAKLQAGAKFKCKKCQTINIVPPRQDMSPDVTQSQMVPFSEILDTKETAAKMPPPSPPVTAPPPPPRIEQRPPVPPTPKPAPPEEKFMVGCISCYAQYNVAKLQAGAKFKCKRCQTINTVPPREDISLDITTTQIVLDSEITHHPSPPVTAPPTRSEPLPLQDKQDKRPAGPGEPKPPIKTTSQPVKPSPAIRPAPPKAMPAKPAITGQGAKKIPTGTPTLKRAPLPAKLAKKQPTAPPDEEGLEEIEVKKKSNVPLIIGIVIGLVAVAVIVILTTSGGGKPAEEKVSKDKKEKTEKEKTEKEKASAEKPKETPKEVTEVKPTEKEKPPEEKKEPEPKTEPVTKTSESRLEIDEALQSEILPILQEIPKQNNDEDVKASKEKIISKGKKIIPILIGQIANKDGQIALYASEILKEMTKWQDAPIVNLLTEYSDRIGYSKNWEEWWLKNKDRIPD